MGFDYITGMRKTRTLLLASVAALALAACDDSITGKSDFVRDEAQCASTDNPSACRQALMDARVEHARTAPAFATRESCEAAFGAANCEAAPGTPTPAQVAAAQTHEATQGQPQQVQQAGGGGFFMPMLMGYMMGRMAGGAMAAQPMYRDTNNRAYSGAGARPMGRFDDRVMPPPRTPNQTANAMPRGPQQTATSPTQARRGGFGSSGMGRMGGG
ncbi:MAG: DUF1190 domain-containing protein [Alphaproteobacteria bacterium]|nr:DUF1190 domain-containing protein [Alphaproteobacteria bacterium]